MSKSFDALPINSGRSSVCRYLPPCNRKCLQAVYFIDQAEPFTSFDAVFQRRQHALRPDRGFHPLWGFCVLFSRLRHCRHFAFALPFTGLHASTFLPPFPRRGVAFRAFRSYDRCSTMKALTSVRVTAQTDLPASLIMPSGHSISNHLTRPCRSFNTLPISSTGPLYSGSGFAFPLADSPTTPGRIEFVILWTGRSPPVALHPASRRRSYVQLQARIAFGLKKTCTSLTLCPRGRTMGDFYIAGIIFGKIYLDHN